MRIAPFFISLLIGSGLILAACAGNPSVSCTVGWNAGTSAGKGTTKAMDLASADVSAIDTSTMSATISTSGTVVSDPGYFTVTLLSGGNVVASTTAPYTRTGSTYTPANPTALNSWIQGYASSIDEADITIDNIEIASVQGNNTLSISSNYQGGTRASAQTSWIHNNV